MTTSQYSSSSLARTDGSIAVVPVTGIGKIKPGDDLAEVILGALERTQASRDGRSRTLLENGDIVVITQKVVSKSEGRLVKVEDVKPGRRAMELAKELKKDPRIVEIVLRESRRVVRWGHGVLITETHHGFVCANSGIDQSNVENGYVTLLPLDPDGSARVIRQSLERRTGRSLAVVITDTFGRPWREGQTDVAIGCAGIAPLERLAGAQDPYGYVLRVTEPAIVDEVAAASELVMGKLSMVPVALVKGLVYRESDGGVREIVRDRESDLFR